jgi:hypothetical protein
MCRCGMMITKYICCDYRCGMITEVGMITRYAVITDSGIITKYAVIADVVWWSPNMLWLQMWYDHISWHDEKVLVDDSRSGSLNIWCPGIWLKSLQKLPVLMGNIVYWDTLYEPSSLSLRWKYVQLGKETFSGVPIHVWEGLLPSSFPQGPLVSSNITLRNEWHLI